MRKQTTIVLIGSLRVNKSSELNELFADALKSRVSVGTLRFVLFLYIQQLHKVSLKASLVAGDEYPFKYRKIHFLPSYPRHMYNTDIVVQW